MSHYLLEDRLLSIEVDDDQRRIRLTRSSVAVQNREEVQLTVQRAAAALSSCPGDYQAIFDLQQAPIKDETIYQPEFASLRALVCKSLPGVVMVVQTRTGLLQVNRFLREEGLQARILTAEEAGETWTPFT